jgi:hypothetical protein
MSAWRFIRSLLVLLAGSVLVAAAYWSLLNVPESNVLALLLSALLVVVIVALAGATVTLASAESSGVTTAHSVRQSIGAMPLFTAGVVLFAVLWYATTSFDGWWSAHRGEVDALVLRYTGWTDTAAMHATVEWSSWLLRWVVGLSVILGLAVAATAARERAVASGLRLSLKAIPLLAVTTAVLFVSQALWRVAPWRPENLPPTSAEVYFAAAKLGVLYLLALIAAAAVITVYRHTAERA